MRIDVRMQILLVAPLNTNHYLAPSFLQTQKHIRDYFYGLNQTEDCEHIDAVVLDSPVPSKRQSLERENKLYVSTKQHQQLLKTSLRPKDTDTTDICLLVQNITQEMVLRKVMTSSLLYVVTWGEFPILREVCESLQLRYLSLQFPAPGSQTLNILQINAKTEVKRLSKCKQIAAEASIPENGTSEYLPIFANVIEERWHYSRYNALPACSPQSYYQNGKKNILILMTPVVEIPDVLSMPQGLRFSWPNLDIWKMGRISHQIEYYLRNVGNNNCYFYFLPLSRQSMRLCQYSAKFLRRQQPNWRVKTLKKISSWPTNSIYTLLQKSDVIVSVNTCAGIDALRNCIPVVFLGQGTESWQWLNPRESLPTSSAALRHLGQQQRQRFRQIKKDLVLSYHWYPNHKPHLLGFSRWLQFAWEAQHELQSQDSLPTLYFQKNGATLPLKANPFIPLNGSQTSAHQRFKERIQLEKRHMRKLRRDPVKYFQDSKYFAWYFRYIRKTS